MHCKGCVERVDHRENAVEVRRTVATAFLDLSAVATLLDLRESFLDEARALEPGGQLPSVRVSYGSVLIYYSR